MGNRPFVRVKIIKNRKKYLELIGFKFLLMIMQYWVKL
jgi:hypothetical protein